MLMDSLTKKIYIYINIFVRNFILCTYSRTFNKIYKILGINYRIDNKQFYQPTSCRLKMNSKI